jgi:CTP:molybdopterin cytidylyltransferase MocA
MTFASIILAAGEGSRLGRCKAALPFADGDTLLSHLIRTYLNALVKNIYIVTGYWKEETVRAAQNFFSAVNFVDNEQPKMGMFSSVCKGISVLDNDIKFFFVHPVDIPLVKEETIMKMKNTIMNYDNIKAWVAPVFKDEEGHPVLISSSLIPELLNWKGKYGLQGYLSSQKKNKIIECVDDGGTVFDIDYQEDYINLQKNHGLFM